MTNKRIAIPLVIAALLAAVCLPIVAMGNIAFDHAEIELKRGNYADAAESYAQAARLLPWRNDLWEKAGISAAFSGNFAQAIQYFRRVSVLSETGWQMSGFSYLLSGDSSTAITTFKQGLQFYDSAAIYTLLAAAYGNQNNLEGQRDALENLSRLDPGNARAQYHLGLILTVLEPEKALTHLMTAASLDPQFDPAVQTLRSALNLSATQPDSAQQMVTNGRALGLVKEWALAIAAFEKAISLDPENAEAWAWLGEAKQQHDIIVNASGNDAGREELDKAVRLDHTSVVVRGLRALYWSRQAKYPQMLAEYSLAAKYEPANPAWQAGIAEAHTRGGDLVSALAAYQRATELAPNESTYWALLAGFCAENGVHLDDVGLPAAQKAVEISPDDPSALDALGQVYLATGRFASAEQTLLDVTKRFPDHLPAHIHLAMTHLAQGRHPAAQNELIFIQNADPNGPYGEMAGQLLKRYFP